jgi:LacI family transcriptional regulator
VALAANVSMMTVSRALNGHDRVSAETRERVMAEAERLGYRPSSTARSLRANQSFLIGVFSPNMMMPLHAELVLGAQESAAQHGYQLLIDVDVSSPPGNHPFVSDGDIIMGAPEDQRRRRPHFDRMRTVSMMGYAEGVDSSVTDLEAATAMAVEHLHQVGYRRIGLIQLPGSPAQAGFERALSMAGLETFDGLIHTVMNDGTGISEAVTGLLAAAQRPDALIVVSVAATPVVLRELRARGLAAGKDIGFVGTEGSRGAWGDLLNPAITAIRVPGYDLGWAAAERLVERLRGDTSAPHRIEFPSDIVIRGSTQGPIQQE